MKVTVDYSVWLGVTVDTATGEVLHIEHGDEPWSSEPESFFNAEHGDNAADEYLPEDHPEAVRAAEIVERLATLDSEVRWHYRDDADVMNSELADSKGRPGVRHPDA